MFSNPNTVEKFNSAYKVQQLWKLVVLSWAQTVMWSLKLCQTKRSTETCLSVSQWQPRNCCKALSEGYALLGDTPSTLRTPLGLRPRSPVTSYGTYLRPLIDVNLLVFPSHTKRQSRQPKSRIGIRFVRKKSKKQTKTLNYKFIYLSIVDKLFTVRCEISQFVYPL